MRAFTKNSQTMAWDPLKQLYVRFSDILSATIKLKLDKEPETGVEKISYFCPDLKTNLQIFVGSLTSADCYYSRAFNRQSKPRKLEIAVRKYRT